MVARLLLLPSMLATILLASCGGSSSETPWPAEPKTAALGPAGESGESGDSDPYAGGPDDESEPAKKGSDADTQPKGSKP